MTSSAKSQMLCVSLFTFIPEIREFMLIAVARGSIIIVKMIGDSGHPCQVLLVLLNISDITLEVYILAEGLEYSAIIAE